jgi:hypothetical protein
MLAAAHAVLIIGQLVVSRRIDAASSMHDWDHVTSEPFGVISVQRNREFRPPRSKDCQAPGAAQEHDVSALKESRRS